MSRRRNDIDAIESRLKDGCGQGRGKDYTPWLTVRDVPSHGLASRIPGHTAGRDHHVFSNLEADCFYLLDWWVATDDIREQFPLLPAEATQGIARNLGLRHPTDPSTKRPIVMTTDFLATVRRDGGLTEEAYAVKPSTELESDTVIAKLEIERAYWGERGVTWRIVTERDMPAGRVANYRWLHSARVATGLPVSPSRLVQVLASLQQAVDVAPRDGLSTVCLREDERLGLQTGACLAVVRYAIATKRWAVDLSARIEPTKPLRRTTPSRTAVVPTQKPAPVGPTQESAA